MTITPAPNGTSHPSFSMPGRMLVAVLATVLWLSTFVGVFLISQPARASEADQMVGLINEERRKVGAQPLTVHSDLVRGAQRQAQAIADAGYLFHNQDLGSLTDGWRRLGENVAYAGSVTEAHRALMNSEGHRENILLPSYTHVGVGVVQDGNTVWVAEVFMEAAGGSTSFTPPFSDDDDSVHEDSIRRLAAAGITSGCGETRFCPDQSVTRGQMAAFLVRALKLPAASGDPFRDDDRSMFEDAIESLAAAGITSGCGPRKFCPEQPVTRGQMAAFLVRALKLPAASGDPFRDDDRSMFEDAIESLAAHGITKGCGERRYCPDAPVTRAEMATFLVRAFRY